MKQPAKLSTGHLTAEASGDLGLGLQPSQVSSDQSKISTGDMQWEKQYRGEGKKTTEEARWQF